MADIAADRTTTAAITLGQSIESAIDFAHDTDLIRVELSGGEIYAFDLLGTASGLTVGDPVLSLMNANLEIVALDDDSGLDLDARIALIAPASGIYYLQAGSFEEQTGTYRLTMRSVVDDWGQVASNSGHLIADSPATGTIDFIGDRDWFRVELSGGTDYSLFLRGAADGHGTLRDPQLTLFDISGNMVDIRDDGVGDTLDSLLSFTPATTGTYYLEASAFDSRIGTYQITVHTVTGAVSGGTENDGDSSNENENEEPEIVDTDGGATPVAPNVRVHDGRGAGGSAIAVSASFAGSKFIFADNHVDIIGANGADEGGVDRLIGINRIQFSDGLIIDRGDGTPLVDDFFYFAAYRDVAASGGDSDAHYAQFGWREGRDPSALFDTSAYLDANRDVARANINPLDHYELFGAREGRDPSALFDSEQYLARNPDVAAAGLNPLAHYLAWGQAEGRASYAAVGKALTSDFDPEYYLLTNPDVAAAGVAPLTHYNMYGWREGRDPNAYFDSSFYLARNPDVAAAGVNPLDHYMLFGWREGRDPSALFDTSYYLKHSPDVAAAGIDPLEHYLSFGRLEGRAITDTADAAMTRSVSDWAPLIGDPLI